MSGQQRPGADRLEGLEPALARFLQAGTLASMAVVALGTVLFVLGSGSPVDQGPRFSLDQLGADLLAGRPAGFLWLGVLAVLGTPMLRVIGALVGFARGGEWGMVGVAGSIVVVVGAGIVAGLLTG